MDIECTGRRIGDKKVLTEEIKTWCQKRNEKKVK
jgi:hypothetical protein